MSKDVNELHPLWSVKKGDRALFTTALHSGHDVRHEIEQLLLINENCRLREEDPYTDQLAKISQNYIIPLRSRFEVDLNRKRNEAVYLKPEDAWGLKVWKEQPSREMIQRTLQEYDQFYTKTKQLLKRLEKLYQHFVIFDLHSYNHRRDGPLSQPQEQLNNPDVNVGTGTMERGRWDKVVDRFISDLKAYNFQGGHLDVRENVKFSGRQFATFVHTNFPNSGCVLSIEIKKIFMDEWTGILDKERFNSIRNAIKSTLPGIFEELKRYG